LNVRVIVALRLLSPNAVAVMVDTYEVATLDVGVPTNVPPVKLIPGGKLFDVKVTLPDTLIGVNTVNVGGLDMAVLRVRTTGDVRVKDDPEFVIGAEELIHMRSFVTWIENSVVATYPFEEFDPTM